jgi:choline-glycine betaine transporter
LAAYLDTATLPTDELVWFKHATEDAKSYYLEAITAQPDDQDPDYLHTIFWTQTLLADALVMLSEQLSSAQGLKQFARILVPRRAIDMRANFSTAD